LTPEPVIKGTHFVQALIDADNDVDVVTAFPNYPGGKIYDGYRLRPFSKEVIGGISVSRLFVFPSHGQSGLGRILNYISFFISAFIFLSIYARRYDVIYVYHPPIMPALATAWSRMFHSVPFVVDIQDLWPDSVAVSGMTNNRIVSILDRCCDHVYERASEIICQSDGMLLALKKRGVPAEKLTRIYNWSTYQPQQQCDDIPFPDEFRVNFMDRLNIVYGGNVGKVQKLETLIEAVSLAAKKNASVRLHLVGGGIERARLAKIAEKMCGDHIKFYDPVPRNVMDRIFEAADILSLHLENDPLFAITIPSKTQQYLAIGKPIAAGIFGEAAVILKDSGAAMVTAPGDVAGLASSILGIAAKDADARCQMGVLGKKYYSQKMSINQAIIQTMQILHRV